jgi:hypothetical protein
VAGKKREKPAPEPEPIVAPAPEPTLPELSGKHRQTLDDLFARPERANVAWNDFAAMMAAAGATVRAKGGSAHSFVLLGRVLVLHRPHPGNELPKAAVRRIRAFLEGVGLVPQ